MGTSAQIVFLCESLAEVMVIFPKRDDSVKGNRPVAKRNVEFCGTISGTIPDEHSR